jgi:hypothetical protein
VSAAEATAADVGPAATPVAAPAPAERVRWHLVAALAICLVLLAPAILTSRTFGPDWTVHLWLLSAQGDAIAHGAPSLFFNADPMGAFYPHFAFYGGTLYALGGGISALLGGAPVVAYLIMWLVGFLMAYCGTLWLSLQAGLRDWRAHAAPVVVVTSAYYLTNAYARGTWPELIATSAIPLVLAATVHLLRAERVTLGPAAALIFGATIFTGSHNISLLWGTVTILVLAVLGAIAVPSLRRLHVKRILTIAVLGGAGIAVNAWFLFPDLAYAKRTGITAASGLFLDVSHWFGSLGNVFDPLRHTPGQSTTPDLFTQLPVLVILWAVVATAVTFRRRPTGPVVRAVVGLILFFVVFLNLLSFDWPWKILPTTLSYVQFTYRLETYIILGLALLVAVLLHAIQGWRAQSPRQARWLELGLGAALAIGVAAGVWQTWDTPSTTFSTRAQATADPHKQPGTWYDTGGFRDRSRKVIDLPPSQKVIFPPADLGDDKLTKVVQLPPNDAPISTNVAAGDYLVRIKGARSVGRTADGYQVVQPVEVLPGHKARLTLEAQTSKVVVGGRVVTYLALAFIAAALAAIGLSGRRVRLSGAAART